MKNSQDIQDLFFDLASEIRLEILSELKKQALKTNDLARQIDLTPTESLRQLQRLTKAKLIQRQPDGSYKITQFCKLVMQLSSAFEFVSKYKEYFLSHDIWRLPYEFVNRIGELSAANLVVDVPDAINHAERMVREAEEYVWTLHDKGLDAMTPIMIQKYKNGVKSFKFMFAENQLSSDNRPSFGRPEVEERTLSSIPAIIVCTEKEAAICFLSNEGRADFAGFVGKDEMFKKWVSDAYLHFWKSGKRVFTSQ